jgi:RimJ/RimL family protein N-acetyltransferase
MRRGSTTVNQSNPADSEAPILNVEGDLVALGPLRRNLLPLYTRWINDLAAVRTLGAFLPTTLEGETKWYEEWSTSEKTVPFTVYARPELRPIGTASLFEVDYRNRAAVFGIFIGDEEYRGKGYGTETTRLVLDSAFTVLGLHNVMLTVFDFNPAGTGFRFCKKTLASHRRTSLNHRTVPRPPASAERCIPRSVPPGRVPPASRARLQRIPRARHCGFARAAPGVPPGAL